MNLSKDLREFTSFLSPRALPLLVLVERWFRANNAAAFQRPDVILYLLQCIQATCDPTARELTLNGEKERLKSIDEGYLNDVLHRLEEVSAAEGFYQFVGLFDNCKDLLQASEGERAPVLDANCNNCIIGLFVRQGVLEFSTMSFSQQVRLHSQFSAFLLAEGSWDLPLQHNAAPLNPSRPSKGERKETDFLAALRELTMWEGSIQRGRGLMGGVRELGSEALELAALHGSFGHTEEGLQALEEAIRLAQQTNNPLLLEHTLAWLHKLQPRASGESSLVILDKFVKNAEEFKLPLLGGWGRLEQAKAQLTMAREPKIVVQTITYALADFLPLYGASTTKERFLGSALSLLAAAWDTYGQRQLGLLYSQLQCHTSCCQGAREKKKEEEEEDEEEEESFALSVCMVVRHLAEQGDFERAEALIKAALQNVSSTGRAYELLSLCLAEIRFEHALHHSNFSTARKCLSSISTFDHLGALYWSALLAVREGDFHLALQRAHSLLSKLDRATDLQYIKLRAKCLLVLVESYCELGLPASALPHVMECLSHCQAHHLPLHSATLWLAQIQLQLGAFQESLKLANDCLIHCHSQGSLLERGRAGLIMSQATLLCAGEEEEEEGSRAATPPSKEEVLAVLPTLSGAIASFKKCGCNCYLERAIVLQAHLYDHIGYKTEQVLSQLHTLQTAA